MLLLLLSRFSRARLCATPETAAHQAPPPWDSPGKNTGVGCHFLLQCMKVKSEREVAQSCSTLSDPMDYSLPGFSIHGIFQARVLEWGAIAFSILSRDKIKTYKLSRKHEVIHMKERGAGNGEGDGTPLQYSCLENPMEGGAWWAAVHGVAKSQTRLKRLSSSSTSFIVLFIVVLKNQHEV